MANYAIMRIEKRKLPSVGRINKHHERLKEEYPDGTIRLWITDKADPNAVIVNITESEDAPEASGK